jgi:DNA-binding transcriptional LysR family regulator
MPAAAAGPAGEFGHRPRREQFPQLRVDVWELDPADSLAALRRGDCDVVVTADFIDGSVPIGPDVIHTPLAEDSIVLVTGAAEADPIDLADLKTCRWAVELPGTWSYDLVTRACRKAGFRA